VGYVTAREHKLLRFFIELHNVGDTDLVIGSPQNRPDLFVHSDVFNTLVFREKFYTYGLPMKPEHERKKGLRLHFA
jgi:hypothetical protein